MTNECPCSRPTRNAAYICDDCADQLSQALGDIPWLAEELETTATRQKGIDYRTVGGSSGGKKPAERPIPINIGANEARTNLKDILTAWVAFCRDEKIRHSSPHDAFPRYTLTELSRWLLWRVDGLTLHEIGADAVNEITDAVTQCHRIIDRPADARFYGQCACKEWLYARPGAANVKCYTCGETHEADHLNAEMWEQAMDRLVTISEARALANRMGFELSESTMFRHVAKWVKESRLVAKGAAGDSGGRKFAFRDVAGLLEAEVRRPAA